MSLLTLLQQTITVEHYTGTDSYNRYTYAAPVTLAARVEFQPHINRSNDGEQIVQKTVIFLDGDPGIDPRDRITLPTGEQPLIESLERHIDSAGKIHHTTVTVG